MDYNLTRSEIDEHFSNINSTVKSLWKLLAFDLKFPKYHSKVNESIISDEFYYLSDLRTTLWTAGREGIPYQSSPLFKPSQEHLLNKKYRKSNCITFEHTATDNSYNSSCVEVSKRRFFALEGPCEENTDCFLNLIVKWGVSYLVCLTDEKDKSGSSTCYPYWKNRVIKAQNETLLNITNGSVSTQMPYVFWPDWEDYQGTDPEKLVNIVNQVRNKTPEKDIIAVHCSAGVGRTGTFIAATCLLDNIDKQLKNGIRPNNLNINIAKLFMYLNFHRPWLIATSSQYITLYKVVDFYIDQLKSQLGA